MKTSLLTALCGAFTLTLLSAAQAQMPPAAGAAPGANPAPAPDPMRLPGDAPPPPMGAVPRPAGAGGPPPDTTPSPSLALALEAAQAALDACTADGLKVGVAVVDAAGQLHVGLIAEGARPGRIYTAVRKDLVALAFKTPTSEVQAKLAAGDPAAAALVKPNMMTVAGAVPLMAGDQLLGAIGVSGATSQQDEKCAAAGAAKIKAKLK
jgi:uncharacterized protein GlcG (DUF336 family)